jgi:hypothetical protein
VCDLAVLSAVITDDSADPAEVARLEEAGLAVMIASVQGSASAGVRSEGGQQAGL